MCGRGDTWVYHDLPKLSEISASERVFKNATKLQNGYFLFGLIRKNYWFGRGSPLIVEIHTGIHQVYRKR